ncbi:unnamed protein product [Phaedon cochleariae]|uniref:Monocarboxylate transporter n=1 Tax=Phaedon cochleariae TaxID=80249 RepID=A0A9P0DI10_PHACE|nr:unnamed protein product [Phaedon cochleariae]
MMENKKEEKKKEVECVYPDGGYGWVIVFAIVLINSTLMSLVQFFGIIFHDEFASMGISAAQTSFLLHLHSSMYCVVGFVSSPLLKKYNFQVVAGLGAFFWCLGILITSFADSYSLLISSVSLLIGLGQGILLPATYLATYSYFKKRLTLAVSISTTGASLASIFMPKVCDILLARLGRRNTVLVLFANSLLSLVGVFLLRPVRRNDPVVVEESQKMKELEELKRSEDETINCDMMVKENTQDQLLTSNVYNETTLPCAKPKNGLLTKLYDLFDLDLFKHLPFILVVVGLGISFSAELSVILMMQFLLPELSNFTRSDVANVTSFQFAFDIVGRLLVPFLGYRLDVAPKLMYMGALVLATFARTVLAVFGKSFGVVYFSCCLIGLTKGTRAVYQSVIIPKILPLEKIPAANGITMLFNGGISLVLGPIIGAIHDAAESYVPVLHTASALSFTCVILWVLDSIFRKKKAVIPDL